METTIRTGSTRVESVQKRRAPLAQAGVLESTNLFEQLLILATVTLLPLQEVVPSIAGFSLVYLLFAAQAGYVFAKRPQCLARTWLHPLLVTVYVFLIIGWIMELSKPYSVYGEITQMVQSFAGSAFLAALCRDRRSLRFAMYGFLASGIIYAGNLMFNSYGSLSGASAASYGDADKLREAVFQETPLNYNLNGMAFVTAQAAGVAFTFALTAKSRWLRYLYLGIAGVCFIATFLPMSRGGIIIVMFVCAAVVFAYGLNRGKTLGLIILLGAVTIILVPEAVWQRFAFSTDVDEFGRMEGRAAVYTAFFHHLPEFVLTGVGNGGFWNGWAQHTMFSNEKGGVVGSHNVYFQMTLYWGLPAFLALLGILFQSYRCLPGKYGDDDLAICILVVAVSLLVWSLQVHNLYDKAFSVGIGLMVSSRVWIWNDRRVRSNAKMRPKFLKRISSVSNPTPARIR